MWKVWRMEWWWWSGAIDGLRWIFTLGRCEGQRGSYDEVIDHLRKRDAPTPHNASDSLLSWQLDDLVT